MTTVSINSARLNAWVCLMDLVDRKVDSVFTLVFVINEDFIMALLVLLLMRPFAP
jgi:hypothetical protein